MKECNECRANCWPKDAVKQSNLPCPRATKDSFKFPLTDCISRVTITNPKSDLVGWFMEYAR